MALVKTNTNPLPPPSSAVSSADSDFAEDNIPTKRISPEPNPYLGKETKFTDDLKGIETLLRSIPTIGPNAPARDAETTARHAAIIKDAQTKLEQTGIKAANILELAPDDREAFYAILVLFAEKMSNLGLGYANLLLKYAAGGKDVAVYDESNNPYFYSTGYLLESDVLNCLIDGLKTGDPSCRLTNSRQIYIPMNYGLKASRARVDKHDDKIEDKVIFSGPGDPAFNEDIRVEVYCDDKLRETIASTRSEKGFSGETKVCQDASWPELKWFATPVQTKSHPPVSSSTNDTNLVQKRIPIEPNPYFHKKTKLTDDLQEIDAMLNSIAPLGPVIKAKSATEEAEIAAERRVESTRQTEIIRGALTKLEQTGITAANILELAPDDREAFYKTLLLFAEKMSGLGMGYAGLFLKYAANDRKLAVYGERPNSYKYSTLGPNRATLDKFIEGLAGNNSEAAGLVLTDCRQTREEGYDLKASKAGNGKLALSGRGELVFKDVQVDVYCGEILSESVHLARSRSGFSGTAKLCADEAKTILKWRATPTASRCRAGLGEKNFAPPAYATAEPPPPPQCPAPPPKVRPAPPPAPPPPSDTKRDEAAALVREIRQRSGGAATQVAGTMVLKEAAEKLQVALLVDSSGSMQNDIADIGRFAPHLIGLGLRQVRDGKSFEMALWRFADQKIDQVVPLATDREQSAQSDLIASGCRYVTQTIGGNAEFIWDAIKNIIDTESFSFEPGTNRRIVIMTDEWGNSTGGLDPQTAAQYAKVADIEVKIFGPAGMTYELARLVANGVIDQREYTQVVHRRPDLHFPGEGFYFHDIEFEKLPRLLARMTLLEQWSFYESAIATLELEENDSSADKTTGPFDFLSPFLPPSASQADADAFIEQIWLWITGGRPATKRAAFKLLQHYFPILADEGRRLTYIEGAINILNESRDWDTKAAALEFLKETLPTVADESRRSLYAAHSPRLTEEIRWTFTDEHRRTLAALKIVDGFANQNAAARIENHKALSQAMEKLSEAGVLAVAKKVSRYLASDDEAIASAAFDFFDRTISMVSDEGMSAISRTVLGFRWHGTEKRRLKSLAFVKNYAPMIANEEMQSGIALDIADALDSIYPATYEATTKALDAIALNLSETGLRALMGPMLNSNNEEWWLYAANVLGFRIPRMTYSEWSVWYANRLNNIYRWQGTPERVKVAIGRALRNIKPTFPPDVQFGFPAGI